MANFRGSGNGVGNATDLRSGDVGGDTNFLVPGGVLEVRLFGEAGARLFPGLIFVNELMSMRGFRDCKLGLLERVERREVWLALNGRGGTKDARGASSSESSELLLVATGAWVIVE